MVGNQRNVESAICNSSLPNALPGNDVCKAQTVERTENRGRDRGLGARHDSIQSHGAVGQCACAKSIAHFERALEVCRHAIAASIRLTPAEDTCVVDCQPSGYVGLARWPPKRCGWPKTTSGNLFSIC